jgi:acetyl-CoA C-acetyltransferase
MRDVVIVDAVRTPVGKRNGSLARKHSNELLGDVLVAVLQRSGLPGEAVDHVIAGCVSQVGMQSSNVARNAWLAAGLPMEVPAVTVTVQCGSAQESATLGHGMLAGGLADTVVVGGVENMSAVGPRTPVPSDGSLGLPRGARYAETWEVTSQFEAADRIAERWDITRAELDEYGKLSQDRAARAWAEGRFDRQVIPIEAPIAHDAAAAVGGQLISVDEGLRPTELATIERLRANQPGRVPVGRHTAATSSQVSDGASAVLLMTAERTVQLGLRPRARLVDSVLVGSDPVMMLTGPIPATAKLLSRNGLTADDIDVYEVNEAFASVVLAWARETKVDLTRVNVNGGAIAMGHPLGATGGILLGKALCELERSKTRYGVVSMCCGGGLGTATLIERIP